MDVNVLLFDRFTALDFTGPVEALSRIDEYRTGYFSKNGEMVSNGKNLSVDTRPLSEISGGIMLIPGGMGTRAAVLDQSFI